MSKPDRWERAAARETERRKKAAGALFAPLVVPVQPKAVQVRTETRVDAQAQAIAAGHAELEAKGQIARATVAAHISAEELAALDRRRAWCPKSGEYTADFWCGECRKRGLTWPGVEGHAALFAEVTALETAQAQRTEAVTAAAGEQLDLPSGRRFAPEPSRAPEMERLRIETEDLAIEEAAELELAVASGGQPR